MQISIIGCPFQTAFGAYIESLKAALERGPGNNKVRWVGSNCGCNVPADLERRFQTRDCEYFEMPHVLGYAPSKNPLKYRLKVRIANASGYFRARRYSELSRGSEVVHFQQILNAFGSGAVFLWLKRRSSAAKVVTIHEFDGYQQYFPELNKTYHRADALIVHCEEMKDELLHMGIPKDKVHVVLHGADIPPLDANQPRQGIVYYAGHNMMNGKGLQPLFKAMAILKPRLPANSPLLTIHGHYPAEPPIEAKEIARQQGIADRITWLDQLPIEQIAPLYQRSAILMLPFSGSFAGNAAAMAAANGLPVIGTKKAGIADHLDKWGLWVEENNPEQLAERILKVLGDEELRRSTSRGLRKWAEEALSWDVIAAKTLDIYRTAFAAKAKASAVEK